MDCVLSAIWRKQGKSSLR